MSEVVFTDPAVDDLRRIGPDAVPEVLKKILLLLENPEAGYPLGGELTGFRKLVVGRNTWRIVYRIADDKAVVICEIWAVGERADAEVYAEAKARVRAVGNSRPDVVRLGTVIERLGTLTDHIHIEATPMREPVPDWLAERLIYTVGLAREDVAALDLEQAVDLWTEFRLRAR
ncbi:type II toxin-antitoxin system mRNA interferase toxin, RelE/StbE family [Sphaerisporangium album]|uniref:Type II toxin-antitoxin system mRNA interferase toxin, RelE/StbE family n=1 Tax=Sphaerisporangium album TaxID=509200 RepID=A0A367FM55_9ACTN|nr:type II toxin-antitoxin system mRNA interferase toxin, RelE/StbE family [Sphaerisporangium album]RCG31483.1 type II toxin-antitoxin system mRNA interferase toxin, RelE/StbE family [Sphaerisporangium album]